MPEEIRELAEQDPEIIRQQIDETRSALTTKLEALEEQVVGTVRNAKDSVQETIDTVKDTVQETVSAVKETVQDTVSTVKETFDVRLQVQRHPWPMVGGSLVLGIVAGALLGNAQKRRRFPVERMASRGQPLVEPAREPPAPTGNGRAAEPHEPGIMDRFREEIDQVKGMAIGLAMGLVRDVIKENLPQVNEQVGEMMDRVTTKLGGKPVSGPVMKENPFGAFAQNRAR